VFEVKNPQLALWRSVRLDWAAVLGGLILNHYESMTQKRHESKLQERRQERAMETQRLNKLKLGLQMKMAADKAKAGEVRAA
jgi:hypothetical protein